MTKRRTAVFGVHDRFFFAPLTLVVALFVF